jgi:hypothetical protein
MIRKVLSFLAAFTLVVASATGSFASPAVGAGNVEQALMQMERQWCAASIKNDLGVLDTIMADDLVLVSPSGKLTNKTQELADTHSDPNSVCEVDMMQVRVYGNAAVVIGRVTRISAASDEQIRFTDTFIRRNGRWQVVLSSGSEIK